MKPLLTERAKRLCNTSLTRSQRQNGRTEIVFTLTTQTSLLRLDLLRLVPKNEIEHSHLPVATALHRVRAAWQSQPGRGVRQGACPWPSWVGPFRKRPL